MTQKEITRRQMCSEVAKLTLDYIQEGKAQSVAMKQAWVNVKVRNFMKTQIAHFYYKKIDGTIREAWGTLCSNLIPPTTRGQRTSCPSSQVYYDLEKGGFRSYKKANLIGFAD